MGCSKPPRLELPTAAGWGGGRIGRTFSEIERSWVKRDKDESVSTEDWIAHVNHVSHRNLTRFLRDWLYGDTVPPMPGHPDWTADPVTTTAAAARSAAAAPSARDLELGIYKR